MATRPLVVRALLLCVSAASLSACGGGGGSDTPPPPPASFSVSPSVLTFSAGRASAGRPATQIVTGTVSGTINGTLYINISLSGAVASVQIVVINGSSSGEGQVVPALPSALGPGRHTDIITVRACTTDINCTSGNLSGSPRTVEVTYTINGIRTATTSLAYTIGDAPASTDFVRQVALSGFPADVSWTATSD